MGETRARSRLVEVRCRCGTLLDVEERMLGTERNCPACGTRFTASRGAKGKPAISFPGPKTPPPPAGAAGQKCPCGAPVLVRPEHTGKDVKCPACGKTLRFEKVRDPQSLTTVIRRVEVAAPKRAPPPAPAPTRPVDTMQPLLCTCGQQLFVGHEHIGKQAQCPSCGALMVLEKAKDPQSMATTVRARIVGQAPPPNLDSWSLKDFE